jgi:acetate kinase
MTASILCINAGSSSIKFQLFEANNDSDLELRLKGQLEGIAVRPRLSAEDARGHSLVDRVLDLEEVPDAGAAMPILLLWLRNRLAGSLPSAVSHRVVFGGMRYSAPVQIDDEVLEHVRSLVSFMPLHLPPELIPIEIIREKLPNLLQVAVFDTGFHRGHDEVIERFAVPEHLHREGVRRYGYHGISYEYVASRLPEVAPDIAKGRVVVAHLGSGCSMCALVDGRSVEASMSFSGLDGLPMGTRPGRLDPGAVLYLFQGKGMSVKDVEHLLYKECGLKGLSGMSNDVRALTASDDPRAKLALDYFTLHSARMVAELATVMGGIDGLVFTAGVGENAVPVRAAIGARLAWLGLEIDAAANARHGPRISTAQSRIACYVIPTNEELMMARHALALVRSRA